MVKDKLILKLLDELDKQKPKYTKLQKYYNGEHDILYGKAKLDKTRSDERAFFNYCRKTVQNYTGYLLGKPVNYTSKSNDKSFIDEIEKYYSYWEKEHNINLKQQTEIFGHAYEVSYINQDGQFQSTIFNPLEMIAMNDGSVDQNISVAVRKYELEYDENKYVDVWDHTHFTTYLLEGRSLKIINQKNHFFSRCPVMEVDNNDVKKSAFADIIPIIDMYNKIQSTAANEIIDHRQAYLVVENAKLTQEEAEKMKENGILLVPPGSKVYWATKNSNGAFVKDMLKDWQDEIYIQTNQVNLNENFQSNTSGVSIRLKLQELENISAIKEAIFEKALKKRLKLFCEWLDKAKNQQYDWRDVSVTFSRNVPVDEASIATMVRDLQGILPNEELISWLPRVTNPSASIEKLNEETDDMDLDSIGLDNNE
ncbi:phage portal protein [Gracilibacillus caseinilyticus]|uniref:Phage portal protein n=1 Tax=Gracilibacillus caseinilyticus TaxID=2932256 RepID=A0ABY4EV47_9BACI|nr:phage portal protein [Gracilibacillus caseinilyticus]UOQ47748.1 phage portal protein [Gracilibacillus caseinilyticus]